MGWRGPALGEVVLVLTGLDHLIEGAILAVMPEWIIDLTVSV